MAKNVIFFFCDQFRPDALGFQGHPVVKTPNLDRLAAKGVIFNNAYCASPVCVPARASLFTGQYPHTHGIWNNHDHLKPDQPMVIETLKEQGYGTAAVGKLHFFPRTNAKRFDHLRLNDGHWGEYSAHVRWLESVAPEYAKREIVGYSTNKEETTIHGVMPDGQKSKLSHVHWGTSGIPKEYSEPVWIANESISFLEQKKDKPFFLFVSFTGPHSPFLAPPPYDTLYPPDEIELPVNLREELKSNKPKTQQELLRRKYGMDNITDQQMKEVMSYYYASITFIDEQIGRIIKKLEELSLIDDSILVFSADHGELMGNHGLMFKGYIYEESCGIPLIISDNSIPPQKNNSLVSQVDIMPTLLDLLDVPVPDYMQGGSFRSLMDGTKDKIRDAAYAEIASPDHSLHRVGRISEDWTFSCEVYRSNGIEEGELYDRVNDPSQEKNLFYSPEHSEIVKTEKAKIQSWYLKTVV